MFTQLGYNKFLIKALISQGQILSINRMNPMEQAQVLRARFLKSEWAFADLSISPVCSTELRTVSTYLSRKKAAFNHLKKKSLF